MPKTSRVRDDQIDKVIAIESGGQTLASDLRREADRLRRRHEHATRPRGPLTFEEATALHRKLEGELAMPKTKSPDEDERGQHVDEELGDHDDHDLDESFEVLESDAPGFPVEENDDAPPAAVELTPPNATPNAANIADAVMEMVDPAFTSAAARLDAAIAAAGEMKVLLVAHQTNVRSVLEDRDRYVRDLLTAAAQLERRVADETDAIMASLGMIRKDYKIDKSL